MQRFSFEVMQSAECGCVKMSSRAAAAAAHKSKARMPDVMPASQTSVKNDVQPTHKPAKR